MYIEKIKRYVISSILLTGLFSSGLSVVYGEQGQRTQLIVQLMEDYSEAQLENLTQSLSADAGRQLTYFRPLSSKAHVFYIAGPISSNELSDLLARLDSRSDVEFVELDQLLEPQPH